MLMPKWVKDYLTFNRKDRIAAFCVIATIVGSLLLPRLFSTTPQASILKNDSTLLFAVDTLQKRSASKKEYSTDKNERGNYRYDPSQIKSFTAGKVFPFDPNTNSIGDWLSLGLNERTSKTIIKYVSKGGRFYKPEDMLKIWGMPEGFYDRVKDYVKISTTARKFPVYENKPFVREEQKHESISINEADTAAFIALPGIGSKLSARIIAFRDKLGGFYSVEQVGETWGLPDSTFQKIKGRLQTGGNVQKININSATKDELKLHPYVRWNLANAIVEYRSQHGVFKNLEELKNIVLVDESTFEKLKHYLVL
jgi:competence ComEA-like helix-hairpin-helix protein